VCEMSDIQKIFTVLQRISCDPPYVTRIANRIHQRARAVSISDEINLSN